ncbi:type II toxin-antitoxin system HicA family toxin [Rugamonas sp.]|uniref:type II toxin-antitoxin system HicA family toxin n=1 Tax=Rugamonas sp. TaxID=1926287 RepID=UPI00345BE0BD
MKGYHAQIVQQLRSKGFYFLRAGKGSHEIWSNGQINVSVPFNCLSKHTANAILKAAGISPKF